MVTPILPRAQSLIADRGGFTTKEWYDFFRSLLDFVGESSALGPVIQDILNRLAALEADDDADALVQGLESIQVNGTLATGVVQITLVNDDADPGETYYYGTNASGEKGWFPVADALVQGDGIALTVNADGTIDIAHADTSSVTDESTSNTGGAFVQNLAFTFDQFGHVTGVTVDSQTVQHNDTGGKQGGDGVSEFYHQTAAQNTNSAALSAMGTGIAAKTGTGTWAARSFPNGTGYTWTNPGGIAGNPTLVLSANLQAWSGVTTASKADDSAVVHLTGNETIAGAKTFTDRVVIGQETASLGFTAAFVIESDAASPLSSGALVRYTNSTAGAFLAMAKARGTRMAPTAVLSGDFLGELRGFGYHSGSGWSPSTVARCAFRAAEDFTSTANGTLYSILLTPTGSTSSAEYLRLTPATGLIPGTTDNALNLGGASNRWSATYSNQFRPGSGTPIWTSGTGSPEGVLVAPVGSLYTRTDGGAGTTFYVKESGAGNTGWVAK